MELLQAVILGVVQGLTEFIPVSSSAHLAVLPYIMKIQNVFLSSLSFDTALHGGTLLALLIYYHKEITKLTLAFLSGITTPERRKTNDFKLALYLIIGTVPAFLIGYYFKYYIETKLRGPVSIAVLLMGFGLILLLADKIGKKKKDIAKMSLVDSIIIGCAQALALMPGVSRSGITMTTSLFLGYDREASANYSFLLSIPAVAGAFAVKVPNILKTGSSVDLLLTGVGFIAAAISGYAGIVILLKVVKKYSFLPFVIYRLMIGAGLIILVVGMGAK